MPESDSLTPQLVGQYQSLKNLFAARTENLRASFVKRGQENAFEQPPGQYGHSAEEESYSSPSSSNLSDDDQETSSSRSPYTALESACIEHATTGESTLKNFSVMDSESRVSRNSKNISIKGHNLEDYSIDNSIELPRKSFRDIPRIPYDGNCLLLARPQSKSETKYCDFITASTEAPATKFREDQQNTYILGDSLKTEITLVPSTLPQQRNERQALLHELIVRLALDRHFYQGIICALETECPSGLKEGLDLLVTLLSEVMNGAVIAAAPKHHETKSAAQDFAVQAVSIHRNGSGQDCACKRSDGPLPLAEPGERESSAQVAAQRQGPDRRPARVIELASGSGGTDSDLSAPTAAPRAPAIPADTLVRQASCKPNAGSLGPRAGSRRSGAALAASERANGSNPSPGPRSAADVRGGLDGSGGGGFPGMWASGGTFRARLRSTPNIDVLFEVRTGGVAAAGRRQSPWTRTIWVRVVMPQSSLLRPPAPSPVPRTCLFLRARILR